MKALAASFAAGGLFALGLGISGMTRPSKVVGFLDLAGAWDASLAFVMLGGVAVYAALYGRIVRRPAPLFDRRFHLPTRKDIDVRLVLGAALFGIGWALGGFCPGPGLVSAAGGVWPAVVFVVGMTVGTKVEHLVTGALTCTPPAGAGGAEVPPR
ncbi:YeeE/YedE family protein [Chondromyces crocatus]|nr:YeeE/YedE family protein [Chondromyces crocatus]